MIFYLIFYFYQKRPSWLASGVIGHNSERRPPKDYPCQVWSKLVQSFQRRRFKSKKLTTDDGRPVVAKAHLTRRSGGLTTKCFLYEHKPQSEVKTILINFTTLTSHKTHNTSAKVIKSQIFVLPFRRITVRLTKNTLALIFYLHCLQIVSGCFVLLCILMW